MKMIYKSCVIILIVCLSGCGTTNFQQGQQFDDRLVKNIRTGKTTKSEIIQQFGQPPIRQSTGGGNEVWMYNYSQAQGQISPSSYIPFVNMFSTGSNVQSNSRMLRVEFKRDIVSSCTFNKSTSNTSANFGIVGGMQYNPGQSNDVTTPCEEAQ